MADGAAIRLPRILVAGTGHNGTSPPPGLDAGILLRNTDLAALIECALSSPTPPAVELDSIRGLGSDDAAVDFLRRRLSIEIMLTRRPQAASAFAAAGGLALLNVLAFDSTGLRRSLHGHPRGERVGTVISPGLVLHHMLPVRACPARPAARRLRADRHCRRCARDAGRGRRNRRPAGGRDGNRRVRSAVPGGRRVTKP